MVFLEMTSVQGDGPSSSAAENAASDLLRKEVEELQQRLNELRSRTDNASGKYWLAYMIAICQILFFATLPLGW